MTDDRPCCFFPPIGLIVSQVQSAVSIAKRDLDSSTINNSPYSKTVMSVDVLFFLVYGTLRSVSRALCFFLFLCFIYLFIYLVIEAFKAFLLTSQFSQLKVIPTDGCI